MTARPIRPISERGVLFVGGFVEEWDGVVVFWEGVVWVMWRVVRRRVGVLGWRWILGGGVLERKGWGVVRGRGRDWMKKVGGDIVVFFGVGVCWVFLVVEKC